MFKFKSSVQYGGPFAFQTFVFLSSVTRIDVRFLHKGLGIQEFVCPFKGYYPFINDVGLMDVI